MWKRAGVRRLIKRCGHDYIPDEINPVCWESCHDFLTGKGLEEKAWFHDTFSFTLTSRPDH